MLEVRTILVIMSIGSLLMALTLWVAFARRFQDGLAKWTMALMLQSLTWGLYSMHGVVPAFLSVTVADAALTVSWAFKLASLLEFRQKTIPLRQLAGVTVLSIAILFALSGLGYEQEWLLFRGVLFTAATLCIGWQVWRIPHMPESRIRVLMTGIYMAVACGFFIRAGVAVWWPEVIPGPIAQSSFQTFTFLFGNACIVMSSFCLLLIHKEQADNKNYLLAITDPLTGIYNRRTFMEHADKVLAHSARTHSPVTLLMLDLDYFKRVNDKYGHATGDEVLKGTVKRMQKCLRKEDILMRFGGEEFCVLLPGTDIKGGVLLAERVLEGISSTPIQVNREAISITVSIGVAMVDHTVPRAKEALFNNADKALYEAKGAGRNRVMVPPAA